ncbi:MAG: glycosyltransferase family 52 protein [Lachnospiraceae bacterium]|nr:glycosyltransferase family 52 protein [Lachnospiraceae bacterium]
MFDRIYICHTIYHVYIACLKEMNRGTLGGATLVLSKMSSDFKDLKSRAEKSPIFDEVYEFDEKDYSFFPELIRLKRDSNNIIVNMIKRIRFCKKYGKLQERYIPVDMHKYKDIYVFCDSDPIGYYLSYKKIYYHALEDGLDAIKGYDTARYDNRGFFKLKAWLASKGIIFIQNGYGKYCIDMEVNNISILPYLCKKYVEVPRKGLTESLTSAQKQMLMEFFLNDSDSLKKIFDGKINQHGKKRVMILSEPLCDFETRKQIFKDIIDKYGKIDGEEALIVIKQHPRDLLDYRVLFPAAVILDGSFPMELLSFMDNLHFDRIVSVFTVLDSFNFTEEKVILGEDFMDMYEDPKIHRQNEAI